MYIIKTMSIKRLFLPLFIATIFWAQTGHAQLTILSLTNTTKRTIVVLGSSSAYGWKSFTLIQPGSGVCKQICIFMAAAIPSLTLLCRGLQLMMYCQQAQLILLLQILRRLQTI